MNLYLTADQVGGWSGGSQVTFHESAALKELGPCEVWDRGALEKASCGWMQDYKEPWKWDGEAASICHDRFYNSERDRFSLCHLYAGTFSLSVDVLKKNGCKVAYTAAAHDIQKSRVEHEKFGIDFAGSFPHLCTPDLWQRYLGGYLAADIVVCPSRHSAECMRRYGCRDVRVIPHGVVLPEQCAPLPRTFVVGYLGSYAPDKGVIYLLQAWARLSWDGPTLVLAGRDSTSDFVTQLIAHTGARHVVQQGFVENVSDFYNQLSVYVQPSITEGFGIEVLEAMAHRRPVLCSDGAGACDIVPGADWGFPAGSVEDLVERLDSARQLLNRKIPPSWLDLWRMEAWAYQWPLVRERYKNLWRELLSKEA